MTIIGLYVRRRGGWVSTAELVRLSGEAGISSPLARTAMARLKKRGILEASRAGGGAGYVLPPGAERMLARGDSRILETRVMAPGDSWCLISFSVPEEQRQVRHQLRRKLQWIGCGLVAPGLWICPDFLRDEVEDILTGLHVRPQSTLFTTSEPRAGVPIQEAVREWWDLPALASLHQRFIDVIEPLLAEPASSTEEAFRRYVIAVDAWRPIPYLDPGLPNTVLPADWPGFRSVQMFQRINDQYAQEAWRHVEESM